MVENFVRERREKLNISQGELSRRSGVGQNTISMLETQNRQPMLETAARLARALECNLFELFEVKEDDA